MIATLAVIATAEGRARAAEAIEPDGDPFAPHPPPPEIQPARQPAPWAPRALAFETQLGFGGPLGLLGVSLDFTPVPLLTVSAGLGLGWDGFQYEGSARFRSSPVGRAFVPYFGAGVSAGSYEQDVILNSLDNLTSGLVGGGGSDPVPYYHWDTAYWTNVETGAEVAVAPQITVRVFVGVGILLNPGSAASVPAKAQPDGTPLSWAPYLGIGIGCPLVP